MTDRTTDTSSISRPQALTDAGPPVLGIIGGGQLARMTAMAALRLGYRSVVLERSADCPAAATAECLVGDWNSADDLFRLAESVDVLTLENEFVDAAHLAKLEAAGHKLWPTSRSIALVQDKLIQKQTLLDAGIPVPGMRGIADLAELESAVAELGLPLVLKARRNGYDGKGNATIRTREDMASAWQQLRGDQGNALYVEEFCPFVSELAVVITRGLDGATVVYPLVETVQKDHVCNIVRAPAMVAKDIAAQAKQIALGAIEAVGAVGTFAVEMFLRNDGGIVVNELAPRVHNSGHYTIEACACSQFENHVRAVLGLPLGSSHMVSPHAVMVNLLGKYQGTGTALGLDRALAVAGANLHLYGKTTTSAGRKMGHVTALGKTPEEAERAAVACADAIIFQPASSHDA
jgi:5-(carboxyamino)imidazole ribonucleotide synthase